jgi:hypothetical protein
MKSPLRNNRTLRKSLISPKDIQKTSGRTRLQTKRNHTILKRILGKITTKKSHHRKETVSAESIAKLGIITTYGEKPSLMIQMILDSLIPEK